MGCILLCYLPCGKDYFPPSVMYNCKKYRAKLSDFAIRPPEPIYSSKIDGVNLTGSG